MFDKIIQLDKEALVYLNNLGTEQFDALWLGITNQFNWIPLFLIVIILVFKYFGWKRGGFIILAMIIMVAFSDQFTNFIKNTVQRLRPNNDPDIRPLLRILKSPRGYSFMSGHATTSTVFSVFVILLLKDKFKYVYCILFFPMVFAYSRLYLGVHYPIDIFVGLCIGATLAFLYFKLVKLIESKLFKQ